MKRRLTTRTPAAFSERLNVNRRFGDPAGGEEFQGDVPLRGAS